VPSARQNTSASSVSKRLHWGQRFIPIQVTRPFSAMAENVDRLEAVS
jgi:hypothetical protein